MALEIAVADLRINFADVLNRVYYGGERVIITRHGKPVAAIMHYGDLQTLRKLENDESDNTN